MIKKSTKKCDCIVLQGSASLYLHNVIKRTPNDIDILFTSNLSLKERNELWYEIIKNFDVVKYEVENELIKTCIVDFGGEKFKIDNIVGKALDDYFIDQNGSWELKTTNHKFFYASKIVYFAYIIAMEESPLKK